MSTRKKSEHLRKCKAYILLFALLPFFMMKIIHHHTDFAVAQNEHTLTAQTTIVSGSEKCAICEMLLTFFTLEKELLVSTSTLTLSLKLIQSLDKIPSDSPTSFFLRAPPLLFTFIQ